MASERCKVIEVNSNADAAVRDRTGPRTMSGIY